MSASILTAVNLTELIAQTSSQFVELAARLANDHARLIRMRKELRQQMKNSPLCDAPSFTRRLEATYRQFWQRWCNQHEE